MIQLIVLGEGLGMEREAVIYGVMAIAKSCFGIYGLKEFL